MNLSPEELKQLREANPDINIPDEDIRLPDGVKFNDLIDEALKHKQKVSNIKEVKKKLGLTNADIAKMFGYKTEASYRNSSSKNRIEKGIVELFKLTQT